MATENETLLIAAITEASSFLMCDDDNNNPCTAFITSVKQAEDIPDGSCFRGHKDCQIIHDWVCDPCMAILILWDALDAVKEAE